jgi:hypothetical protein
MRMSIFLLMLWTIVGAGCSKKADQPAAKPVETTATTPAPTAPAPAPTAPAPAPATTGLAVVAPSDVQAAGSKVLSDNKAELAWVSPDGAKVALAVKKSVKAGKHLVELLATTDKPVTVTTVDSGVGDEAHEASVGAVGLGPDGSVVFVAGSVKTTGKPADHFEYRIYAWDAAAKQLRQVRNVVEDSAYTGEDSPPSQSLVDQK